MELKSRDLIDKAKATIDGLGDLLIAIAEAPNIPTANELHALRILCESASDDLAKATSTEA